MPDGELKIGKLQRDLPVSDLQTRKADAQGPTTLSFSASSEAPVERWFGTEVLSHDKGAVNLDRVQGGAVPILFNHDWSDPIGMADTARLKDGRLMVDAHLFATERAQEVLAMVEGGLRNISVGYQIRTMEEDTKTQTYTARNWEPLEFSIVTVPADASIGIGRAAEEQAITVQVIRAASTPALSAEPRKEIRMDPVVTTPAAGENAEAKKSAFQLEEQRKQAIRNLCKANRLDQQFERHWIEQGSSLDSVADEMLKVMEERGNTKPQSAADIGMSDREVSNYSWFRALRFLAAESGGARDTARRDAGFEIEASQAVAKRLGRDPSGGLFIPYDVQRGTRAQRDMAANPGGKGGYLVAADNLGFIEILRNRSVLMRMGATNLSGLEGQVTIPRQTGAASLVWQNTESTAAATSDQTLGQLSMSPKNAIAGTIMSRQLMMQSSPSAEQMIRNDLAAVVGLGVDLAGIQGTGGAQPIGIINTAGITTGVNATSCDYAKALSFQSSVASANALFQNDSSGYITTPAVAALLLARSRFASTDTPLWDGNVLDGRMAGFAASSSLQVPTANLLFGDFSKVIIGEWGVLELSVNPYQVFMAAQVAIRAIYTVDVLVRYPQAFALSTSAT